MEELRDFARKDMIEQIMLLEEIKEGGRLEALPALLDLYAEPLADQAVDEMVYHTLYDLLADQGEKIAAALAHPSLRVRLLAVRRAGDSAVPGTLPGLFSILDHPPSAELLSEAIRALGNFQDPEVIDRLLPFLEHEDYAVTAWAMRVLAGFQEPRVQQALMRLIASDQGLQQGECDLRPALAVETLARFGSEEIARFLIGHIHHPCPAFRKEVISALAAMGAAALPALGECLEQGDRDEKIMAANTLGLVGDKKSADILVEQLHQPALEPNLKFAIYEALGRIPSMLSVVGLSDGLAEEDEMVLLAVVAGLDQLVNPGVVKALQEALARGDAQSGRVLKAMVTGRAARLFASLYKAGLHTEALIEAILASGDREAAAVFRSELEQLDGEPAAADCRRLTMEEAAGGAVRILAADDSKAMLFFYKGVAAELGVELITAGDGKEALDLLQAGTQVDLLITDMNMPNMDGVELARQVRKQAQWATLPILMATTESERSQSDLARAAGVNEFISKPFTSEQLRGKIDTILPGRSA